MAFCSQLKRSVGSYLRNKLKPAAELNGSGALVAQFVYASKSHVPELSNSIQPNFSGG